MKRRVLVVDIGGTHVKLLMSLRDKREFDSGPKMKPADFVRKMKSTTAGWKFDTVSVGFPSVVRDGRVARDPKHLGRGWVGFDFSKALGRPVRVINDAAMQALGSYRGKRMLFLGLGTGLGSALILDGVLEPMELAHLPYKKGRTYEDCVGKAGMKRSGKKKWRRQVLDVIDRFRAALAVDDVVLGGGNAKLLKKLPAGVRLGANANAFVGGYRLWKTERVVRQLRPAR